MTIHQLQYVLEICKTGSMSRAAKNLYISQPNISNAVRNLEQELGITIFERNPMGMELTPAGRRLAQKAAGIMADIREIKMECQQKEVESFRLVYPRYLPALDAFAELCRAYQDNPINFSCYIGNELHQVENIYRNHCDLVVYLNNGSSQEFERMCEDLHVKFEPLKKMQYYVQLSEHHPLLKEKSFELEELKKYPCVTFCDLEHWNKSWFPAQTFSESFIDFNRLIRVQSTSARLHILGKTNAYSIVLPHSEQFNREHHVVQIPIKNQNQALCLGYLYSADRGLSALAKEYITLLEKHLAF